MTGGPTPRPARELPRASAGQPAVADALRRGIAIFLDYDGTLTPIVRRPSLAILAPEARAVVARLATRWPVAILSGRDLADVRDMVGVEGVAYAGSHGFDVLLPRDASARRLGAEFEPALAAAHAELAEALRGGPRGAWVEPKRAALAVHVREVDRADVPTVEGIVEKVAAGHPDLRRTGGKEVFELRPAMDWDKGRALRLVLEAMGQDRAGAVPIYVGDDETDEDAFAAVKGRGVPVIVALEDDARLTLADLRLDDPPGVLAFLEDLAGRG